VTIGIGLVGCGRWGLNYLRAFSELDGCRVVAACDVSPDRLREAERRAPGVRTSRELGELLAAPDLDAALEWGRKLTRATTLPTEVRPFQGEAEN